jgi:hypothetical protein
MENRKKKLRFRQCPISRIRFSSAEEWGKAPRTGLYYRRVPTTFKKAALISVTA